MPKTREYLIAEWNRLEGQYKKENSGSPRIQTRISNYLRQVRKLESELDDFFNYSRGKMGEKFSDPSLEKIKTEIGHRRTEIEKPKKPESSEEVDEAKYSEPSQAKRAAVSKKDVSAIRKESGSSSGIAVTPASGKLDMDSLENWLRAHSVETKDEKRAIISPPEWSSVKVELKDAVKTITATKHIDEKIEAKYTVTEQSITGSYPKEGVGDEQKRQVFAAALDLYVQANPSDPYRLAVVIADPKDRRLFQDVFDKMLKVKGKLIDLKPFSSAKEMEEKLEVPKKPEVSVGVARVLSPSSPLYPPPAKPKYRENRPPKVETGKREEPNKGSEPKTPKI